LLMGDYETVRDILGGAGATINTSNFTGFGDTVPAPTATGILSDMLVSGTDNWLTSWAPLAGSSYVTQRPANEQPKLNPFCFIAPAIASPLTNWVQSLFGDNQFGEVVTGVLNGFLGYKMYDECVAPYANLYNDYYGNYGYGSGYTANASTPQYTYDNPNTPTVIFRGTFRELVQSLTELPSKLTPAQLNRLWNTNAILQIFN